MTLASRSMASLKPIPQVEAPGQVLINGPFTRQTAGTFQSAICAVPWEVVACQELSLQLLQSHET